MHNLNLLPKPLLEELRQIAATFDSKGLRLILFGSFAEGKGRPNSDVDLAFDVEYADDRTIKELHERIEDLHTVRSVDLVDLKRVDPGVAEEILTTGRSFSDCLGECLTGNSRNIKANGQP